MPPHLFSDAWHSSRGWISHLFHLSPGWILRKQPMGCFILKNIYSSVKRIKNMSLFKKKFSKKRWVKERRQKWGENRWVGEGVRRKYRTGDRKQERSERRKTGKKREGTGQAAREERRKARGEEREEWRQRKEQWRRRRRQVGYLNIE